MYQIYHCSKLVRVDYSNLHYCALFWGNRVCRSELKSCTRAKHFVNLVNPQPGYQRDVVGSLTFPNQ